MTGRPSVDSYGASLQDTPQNVTVVTKEVLTQQGADNLVTALRNVPGITLNAGEGGTHGDNINLRGFAASDDFFLDGLRDTGFYTRDSFDLEGIEVYKGPASTLFGRGSTGGVVNQVSKTPQPDNFARASLAGGTNSEVRGTADINYALNSMAAVRFNVMAQNVGVEDRDFVRNRRWGAAPSLALWFDDDMTFTLQYLHQQQDDTPDYGIPFAFGAPVPVPRETYYGLPSDDRTRANDDVVTAKFKDSLNENLWVTETARYGNYFFDSRETAAHYGATAPAPGMPLDTVLTFRDRPSAQGTVRTIMNDADLHMRIATGPVRHHFVVGLEADREEASLTRFNNQLNQIPGTPILNPDPFEPFPGHQSQVTQLPDTVTDTISGLIEDIVDFGQHWEATAAVRVDRFRAEFSEPIRNQHYSHTDTIASPRVSLVYKPVDTVSFYASYGTSYDPSAENLSLTATTASLGPEKDRTYETGAKSTLLNGQLTLQADAFQTQMINARVGDPTNPTAPQLLAGKERVRGFEVDANGYLTNELEITAGYTHLASVTLNSTNAASVGAPLINTAPNQANLWMVYELEEIFKVGGGLNWLDRRPGDIANTAHVPGYVVFDAMISYRFNPHLSLQVNGYNLANRHYYTNSYFSSPLENHVVPGAGRSALLTAAVDF
ncbi:MAG TPA: TonB-dependent siderophore receptor [Steroidobacteraceae bacterium]|nr:TonB-dependent siderophore receptor [Steroidobacteraceae bacterium]